MSEMLNRSTGFGCFLGRAFVMQPPQREPKMIATLTMSQNVPKLGTFVP